MEVTTLSLRPMTADDMEVILGLERTIFPTPWTEGILRDELAADRRTYLVAEEGGAIVGYGGVMIVLEDAHITNLAVDPAARGRGVATRLFLDLAEGALDDGAEHLTLERGRPDHVGDRRCRARVPGEARRDPGGTAVTDTPAILGIETSCDETAVAVVRGYGVLSNVLASQVEIHARFGGVVPEVAARAHVEAIRALTHRALAEAGIHQMDLDAIAATQGPGLAGALMVGFSYGKALAWALRKPFLGIDHMEGHLFAPRLDDPDYAPPAVVLLASGGHSQIIHLKDWGDYEVMGSTIDDAAGEAFDKLARFLGLGYPGGPAIDKESEGGNPKAVRFPRALADRPFHFSFSGLKTSVVTYVRKHHKEGTLPPIPDLAASIQEAIVDALVAKTFNAVEETGVKAVAGGGGVLANRRLRAKLAKEAESRGIVLHLPSPVMCTDNGAMVAAAGVFRFGLGEFTEGSADINPSLRLGS